MRLAALATRPDAGRINTRSACPRCPRLRASSGFLRADHAPLNALRPAAHHMKPAPASLPPDSNLPCPGCSYSQAFDQNRLVDQCPEPGA